MKGRCLRTGDLYVRIKPECEALRSRGPTLPPETTKPRWHFLSAASHNLQRRVASQHPFDSLCAFLFTQPIRGSRTHQDILAHVLKEMLEIGNFSMDFTDKNRHWMPVFMCFKIRYFLIFVCI